MKKTCVLLMTLVRVACGKGESTDTVDSLVAHSDRLKEVMHRCHEDRAKAGDAECSAVSEAFRRRFLGVAHNQ